MTCERCEQRDATVLRDLERLCEDCAQAKDEQAAEREAAKFHGGTDAWPYHLRGLV